MQVLLPGYYCGGIFHCLVRSAYSQLFNSAENMRAIGILSLGFMVSRCLSGIGVITFPKAKADGTVAAFSRNSSDVLSRNVLIVYLVLLAAGMILIRPVWGSLAFVGALLIFWSALN